MIAEIAFIEKRLIFLKYGSIRLMNNRYLRFPGEGVAHVPGE
jgi:hypothetical protein